jgi:hypothetical protein
MCFLFSSTEERQLIQPAHDQILIPSHRFIVRTHRFSSPSPPSHVTLRLHVDDLQRAYAGHNHVSCHWKCSRLHILWCAPVTTARSGWMVLYNFHLDAGLHISVPLLCTYLHVKCNKDLRSKITFLSFVIMMFALGTANICFQLQLASFSFTGTQLRRHRGILDGTRDVLQQLSIHCYLLPLFSHCRWAACEL